jgi:hypothetical protein
MSLDEEELIEGDTLAVDMAEIQTRTLEEVEDTEAEVMDGDVADGTETIKRQMTNLFPEIIQGRNGRTYPNLKRIKFIMRATALKQQGLWQPCLGSKMIMVQ